MHKFFKKIADLLPFVVISRKRHNSSISDRDQTENTLQALIERLDLIFDIDTLWTNSKMGNLKAMSDISSVLHTGKRRWVKDA